MLRIYVTLSGATSQLRPSLRSLSEDETNLIGLEYALPFDSRSFVPDRMASYPAMSDSRKASVVKNRKKKNTEDNQKRPQHSKHR